MFVEVVGGGPPLVLLHGWAIHAGLWQPIIVALARRFSVHLVDLPGYGGSVEQAAQSAEHIVARLDEQFSSHSAVSVLGWSMGGMLAMRWAALAPKHIERLILVSTSACFTQRADWPHAIAQQTLQRFADELTVDYRATLTRFLSLQMAGSEQGRETLRSLRTRLFEKGQPSLDTLHWGLRILSETDLRHTVGALSQPTLIVSGGCDRLIPVAAGQWLAQTMSKATLLVIEAAGHAPFLSHPDIFLNALEKFLDAEY